MERKSNEQSIAEVLQKLVESYRMQEPLSKVRLTAAWESLMGHTIARHTTEIDLRKGVLYLRLDSSVLREELSYAKHKLIDTLNTHLGQEIIREVKIL